MEEKEIRSRSLFFREFLLRITNSKFDQIRALCKYSEICDDSWFAIFSHDSRMVYVYSHQHPIYH